MQATVAPLLQVLLVAVKSRFAAPWVTTELPPRVLPFGIVTDTVCVVEAPSATEPKLTGDWAKSCVAPISRARQVATGNGCKRLLSNITR